MSANLISIEATSARVAKPLGSNVPSVQPEIIPFSTDHATAFYAQAETFDLSAKLRDCVSTSGEFA